MNVRCGPAQSGTKWPLSPLHTEREDTGMNTVLVAVSPCPMLQGEVPHLGTRQYLHHLPSVLGWAGLGWAGLCGVVRGPTEVFAEFKVWSWSE